MTTRQKYSLLLILGGLSALAPFSIDMYLPAFKSIATSLDTDISQVTLTLTAYFVGISIGQLFYGPITDKFGRKKPLIFGLSLFLLASIGCALSPTINWLITMRILLALGGCVGMVVSRAVVRDLFPVSETAKIFSILMLIVGVAPILAPTMGGWVLAHYTWRSIFYFLTAFSFILIICVAFFLPESKNPNRAKSLKAKDVIKDYRDVFQEPTFFFYAFGSSIAMAGMFAYISGSPFVFMEHFKFTEQEYGWVFGGNAAGFIIGSQLNRLLLNRFSSFQVVKMSSLLLVFLSVLMFGLFSFSLLTPTLLIALLFFYLFSLGLLVPNCTALALAPFTYNAGSASALIGFIQMITGASISGLVSVLHNGTIFPMVFGMFFCGIICFLIILMLNSKVKKLKLQTAEF